jgi:hypothetical protein
MTFRVERGWRSGMGESARVRSISCGCAAPVREHARSIVAGVVFAGAGLVLGFDLVLDGGAGHDAVELLHGGADAGGEAAAALAIASFAAEVIDHCPYERERNADEHGDCED